MPQPPGAGIIWLTQIFSWKLFSSLVFVAYWDDFKDNSEALVFSSMAQDKTKPAL